MQKPQWEQQEPCFRGKPRGKHPDLNDSSQLRSPSQLSASWASLPGPMVTPLGPLFRSSNAPPSPDHITGEGPLSLKPSLPQSLAAILALFSAMLTFLSQTRALLWEAGLFSAWSGGRLSSMVWVTIAHLYCQCLLSWSNNVLLSIVLSSMLVKTVTKTTLGSSH